MTVQLDLFNLKQGHKRIGPVAVCLGVFDGMHRGHQLLVEKTREIALQQSVESGIITFDIDPAELTGTSNIKLNSNAERLELLKQTGVDYILALPFTRQLQDLPPTEFLQRLLQQVDTQVIVVGSNFCFGAKAAGNVELLSRFCSKNRIILSVLDLLEIDDEVVSSERIRIAYQEGDLEQAEKLLGHSI